jgi:hypothetical protein
LYVNGTVKTKLMADVLNLFRGGHLTGQHLRRIPGKQPEHKKEQQ